jgi:hypothetical protein
LHLVGLSTHPLKIPWLLPLETSLFS